MGDLETGQKPATAPGPGQDRPEGRALVPTTSRMLLPWALGMVGASLILLSPVAPWASVTTSSDPTQRWWGSTRSISLWELCSPAAVAGSLVGGTALGLIAARRLRFLWAFAVATVLLVAAFVGLVADEPVTWDPPSGQIPAAAAGGSSASVIFREQHRRRDWPGPALAALGALLLLAAPLCSRPSDRPPVRFEPE